MAILTSSNIGNALGQHNSGEGIAKAGLDLAEPSQTACPAISAEMPAYIESKAHACQQSVRSSTSARYQAALASAG